MKFFHIILFGFGIVFGTIGSIWIDLLSENGEQPIYAMSKNEFYPSVSSTSKTDSKRTQRLKLLSSAIQKNKMNLLKFETENEPEKIKINPVLETSFCIPSTAELIDVFENALTNELLNDLWTSKVVLEAEQFLLESNFIDCNIQNVECHLSICKVVVAVNGSEGVDMLFSSGIEDLGPWSGGNPFYNIQKFENNKFDIVLYFSQNDDEFTMANFHRKAVSK